MIPPLANMPGLPYRMAGLINLQSERGSKETMDRLQTVIRSLGLTIFSRINHAAGAAAVGLTLRPAELIIFGNARAGTPLMQAAPTAGIDLPLKILVWEDNARRTWISYNDPRWIAQRHGATNVGVAVSRMTTVLNAIANAAAHAQ